MQYYQARIQLLGLEGAKFGEGVWGPLGPQSSRAEPWWGNRGAKAQEPFDLICAFLHVQMESNWAGLSACNCRHTGKWCGTIKVVGNTDHTRQTWIHMQTPLSPLAGCGPVGEGTSGKVLNWTVRSLNHAYTTTTKLLQLSDFRD